VLDASKEGASCLQFDSRLDSFRGQEDCLFLNVYTHDASAGAKKRPVMVWIHGGSWTSGSGNGENDIYGPHNLLDRDIVLVTINYRLSVLGFLSTEDAAAPGNYGLLDQVMAMKWVKENIEGFGGDRTSITIFGQSSGAVSVHGHILSPRSKGLFESAIAQSGSALCPWAILNYVGNYTKQLGVHMNCPTSSSVQLVQCLRTKNATDFIQFQKDLQVIDGSPTAFGPRIDVERREPFYPMRPEDIIRSGSFNHVPFVTGVTTNEAGFVVAKMTSKGTETIDAIKEDPAPAILYATGHEFNASKLQKARNVFDNYFPDRSNVNLNTLEAMISDGMFFQCAIDTVKLHTQHSKAPVFSYLYGHRGLLTYSMLFSSDLDVEYGVTHGDEIFLMFAIPFVPPLLVPGDIATAENLLDLWTSFSATGVPVKNNSNIEWLPAKAGEMRYMLIKDELAMVNGEYPFANRVSKWSDFF